MAGVGGAALTTAGSVAVVLLLGFAGRLRARRMDPRRGLREARTRRGRGCSCMPAAADATRGLVRAVHRTVGTYGGVLLTVCPLTVDWSPLQLAVLLAALQFIGEVFVIRHYSIAPGLHDPDGPDDDRVRRHYTDQRPHHGPCGGNGHRRHQCVLRHPADHAPAAQAWQAGTVLRDLA
jgi:hypothetical protein